MDAKREQPPARYTVMVSGLTVFGLSLLLLGGYYGLAPAV